MGPKADDVDRLETEEMMEEDTVEATRVQIEQTRGEMSETIDAIRDKLSPRTLAEEAKEAVAEAASGMVSNAASTVRHAADGAAGAAKDAGVTVMEMIRQNPLPAALIGIGVAWLWAGQRSQRMAEERHQRWSTQYASPYDEANWGNEDRPIAGERRPAARGALGSARETIGNVQDGVSRAAGQAQERVGEMAGRVQESVSDAAEHLSDRVGAMRRQASSYSREWAANCQTMIEERPLAVGAMALGLGAAVGMLVPGTYRENRIMGEARDQLVGKVQDKAEDLASRAQIVAEGAIDTAKQVARDEGLTSLKAAPTTGP